jgi:hypothetical protein
MAANSSRQLSGGPAARPYQVRSDGPIAGRHLTACRTVTTHVDVAQRTHSAPRRHARRAARMRVQPQPTESVRRRSDDDGVQQSRASGRRIHAPAGARVAAAALGRGRRSDSDLTPRHRGHRGGVTCSRAAPFKPGTATSNRNRTDAARRRPRRAGAGPARHTRNAAPKSGRAPDTDHLAWP